MDQILQGLNGVQCNQDDMIIIGKDDYEHLENLRAVLSRLHVHGLKANLEKCQFLRDEVIFCGIKISKEGLHETSDKRAAVVNAPILNDKSQLRSFMGLVNYYHKWLPNITSLAKPLYDLLQDKVKYQWTEGCSKAFLRSNT
ncbi:Pol polyprotein [Plakobranchus ocellatus]|uniref:Pol polyprotein n=1 Tax=Plakobranchus ocellatus TaxID=259542 RepID=A0AAV3YH71_9GAST|nr:Pol polyprotein [Plakobranchus ocellatus]